LSQYKSLLKKIVFYLNKHTFVFSILVTSLFIILSVGLGWYNNRLVLPTTNPIARYTAEPSNPLSFMSNWDGPDYLRIAKQGYSDVSEASFFPLYPLLIGVINLVISSPLYGALAISWASLIGATYYYLCIVKQLFKIDQNLVALKSVLFFLFFPTSIFLAATYTESLFAFLALAAIYFALNRRNLIAGLFVLLATATHLDGVFILLLVAMILLEEKVQIQKIIVGMLLGSIGLLCYMLYLAKRFDSPLSFILSQKGHGWLNHHYTELFTSVDFFNLVFIFLLIITIYYWWNKRRSFSYYSLLFLLIPIMGNQFGGFNRYVLVAFPLQFMAYDYLKDKYMIYSLALGGMGIIWAYFTLQYAGGYIGG
jgi:Gpi18-like mannosyltransferase